MLKLSDLVDMSSKMNENYIQEKQSKNKRSYGCIELENTLSSTL